MHCRGHTIARKGDLMQNARDILKFLTKEELIECLLPALADNSVRFERSLSKSASIVVINMLRQRLINLYKYQSKNNLKNIDTDEDFLKMLEEDKKNFLEQDMIEKQIALLKFIK